MKPSHPKLDGSWVSGVTYPDVSLNQDIKRLREVWRKVQGERDRDAIYDYLAAVYEVIEWWTLENRAAERAGRALRITGLVIPEQPEPFAAVIMASLAPERLDRRQINKWSRALRYALRHECRASKLMAFIKDHGGLNSCAEGFSRNLRRR
jgi:hypothetical protein